MSNPQNLKPWPKGTSGNPKGRPPKTKLTAAMEEILLKVDPADEAGRTYLECMVLGMLRKAAKGDVRAAKEIVLLTEGRVRRQAPRQQSEVE